MAVNLAANLAAGLDPDFEWFATDAPANPQVRDSATLWIMDETGGLAFPRVTFDAIGESWATPWVRRLAARWISAGSGCDAALTAEQA